MAHSYIYIDDEMEERSFGSTDSVIYIYIYFFIQILRNDKESTLKDIFLKHYNDQLESKYWSIVDIKIDYVYEDSHRLDWYLNRLKKVEKKIESFGNEISSNYLNKIDEIKKTYARPILVSKLLGFLNNVRWVLRTEGVEPSDDFVFFSKCLKVVLLKLLGFWVE